MKTKDKMLKKFFKTYKEVLYYDIIKDIEHCMARSHTFTTTVLRGLEEDKKYVINRLKEDGFDVTSDWKYTSYNEECIRIKWLDTK